MSRTRTGIVGTLAALAVGGCSEPRLIPLQRSTITEAKYQKETTLEIGETERGQARQQLGEPLLASEYWRFDAFRFHGWNKGLLFVIPVPIPMWEKAEGFALVAYHEDGRVADYSWGHRAEKGAWIVPAPSETVVELGDLRLWTSGDQLYLAASPKLRDAYLSRPVPEGSCRVVLGCERCDDPGRAYVVAASPFSDDGAVIGARPSESPDMIVWNGAVMTALEPLWPQPLLVLTMTAGSSRVDAVPFGGLEPIPASVQFDCDSGATRYAMLKADRDGDAGATPQRPRSRAVIEITKERPSALDLRPLMIWGHGQWLVEAEPGP